METSEPDPPPTREATRRLDLLLAGSALVLAFLASSFAVTNSDFWFHLANGRQLAQGRFEVGVDPLATSSQPMYWAHPAWGFDLLMYELYQSIGGAGLVLLKAVLIVGLAYLLLRIRRNDGGAWVSATCTILAIVAMSPELQLQPACLSIFFLGLTFWLL